MNTDQDAQTDAPFTVNDTEAPPPDDCLRAVLAPERRRTIRHLAADGNEACTVDELVRACADSPSDGDLVRHELVHVHLPQLAALHVIEYGRTAGIVTRGVAFDSVKRFMWGVDDALEAIGVEPVAGGD